MKIDAVTKQSLLYDFYGELLTKRQRDVMTLYHEENLSLSEIAEEFSISRQGVHDALKNAEKSLINYENKLGLVGKFMKSSEAVERIDGIMDHMIDGLRAAEKSDSTESSFYDRVICETVDKLKEVKSIIDKLED